jgi:peroxiredoxin
MLEEHTPTTLEYAELLLEEDKKREARLLLFAYLKRNPESGQAWWVLSRAVETPEQERDCLERALRFEPGNVQAGVRLDELKAMPPVASPPEEPPSAPVQPETSPEEPAPPVISPFVFSPEEPVPEVADFDIFAPGAFQKTETAPATPAPGSMSTPKVGEPAAVKKDEAPTWALPGSPPEGTPPAQPAPALAPAPAPAKRRKRTWFVDAMIILLVLCLISVVVAFFVFKDISQKIVTSSQQTLAVAQALTALPPQTLEATWTSTTTFTQIPSRTRTPSPTPPTPTITDTLLYTLTRTPIPAAAIGVTTGMYPPDFTLRDVGTGEQVNLSDFAGRPVLLVFWATWCPYCANEMTDLKDIHTAYKDDGLVVLAIDEGDALTDVEAYRTLYGLDFPVLMDADYEVTLVYRASSLPHHVFIGINGRIMYTITGELSYAELESRVKASMHVFPTATP